MSNVLFIVSQHILKSRVTEKIKLATSKWVPFAVSRTYHSNKYFYNWIFKKKRLVWPYWPDFPISTLLRTHRTFHSHWASITGILQPDHATAFSADPGSFLLGWGQLQTLTQDQLGCRVRVKGDGGSRGAKAFLPWLFASSGIPSMAPALASRVAPGPGLGWHHRLTFSLQPLGREDVLLGLTLGYLPFTPSPLPRLFYLLHYLYKCPAFNSLSWDTWRISYFPC